MSNPFLWLDAYVLNKFQKFSEYQQVEHGRTCYDLAYVSHLVVIYALMMLSGLCMIIFAFATHWVLAGFLLCIFVATVLARLYLTPSHRKWYRSTSKLPEIPVRFRFAKLCMAAYITLGGVPLVVYMVVTTYFIGLIIVTPIILFVLFVDGWTAESYFASCTPLPPEQLRFRKGSSAKRGAHKPGWQVQPV